MKKYKFIILCLTLTLNSIAQVPSNDPTWQIVKQDDFNSFDGNATTGWINGAPWDQHWSCSPTVYNDNNTNLSYTGGWLKQKVDVITTPYVYNGALKSYTGAQIFSNFQYKYGYYEISAKMPQGQGYWGAFWLWSAYENYCSINDWYDEIDIQELNGDESATDHSLNQHYWYMATHAPNSINCPHWCENPGNSSITVAASLSAEHTYGLLWTPREMVFYFDGQIVRRYDKENIPTHAMSVILDFSIDPSLDKLPDGSTTFPAYYEVNYLKIWQQVLDCNTHETFCSTAFNPATYDYAVKQDISIGGSGCSAPSTISTSSNVALWATDYILLGEGTTISDGGTGTFLMDVNPCPSY